MSKLAEAKVSLVRRWGEMGGYWGINRTMAEIHALLFVSRSPLCTDDIMEQLQVSRGNASMNLRALVDWGLVERVHIMGDRKEYFRADTDVWHMFETIMRERRRREVEPIIATIDRCRELVAAPDSHKEDKSTNRANAADVEGNGNGNGARTVPGGAAADADDVKEFRRRIDELQNFLATMGALFELVLRFGNSGIGQLTRLLAAPAVKAGSKKSDTALRSRATR